MAQKTVKSKKALSTPQPQALWRKLAGGYLLTNDAGAHVWLKEQAFRSVVSGKADRSAPDFAELSAKGFIRDRMDFEDLAAKWKKRNAHLSQGPGLHILVLTLRCNHKCLYCQSSAVGTDGKKTDMDRKTARKSVDFALKSPNKGVTIEFQGGEPLLNWEVLASAVVYARKAARAAGKELKLALVSNFSLMTEEKARFLLEHEVSLCTSLDGPADLHDKNRVFTGGNSHAAAVKWLKYFQKKHGRQVPEYRIFKPSALLTVSKYSLARAEEIIDEYAALGLNDIFIRPLAPIGYARRCWDKIGYEAAEFSRFYRDSLAYMLKLNARGVMVREKTAAMMLDKILNFRDPGYLDMRCPCGAGVGQLAYNYNGDLYTCDEGRMVGWEGDDLFKIGNVFRDDYKKAVLSPAVKVCVLSSNLESQPMCSRCAYKPYCGVCPVYNYEVQNSLWGNMSVNDRCGFFKGIFETIFTLLRDKKKGELLKKWVTNDEER